MSVEKIDIHNTDVQLKQATAKLIGDSTIPIKNRVFIKDFLEASIVGLTASSKARIKEVGTRARLKNLYLLKIPGRFFKKSFDKLTKEDLIKFIKALKDNSIKKSGNKKYSEKTKSNIKGALIAILRWIHKESSHFFELTSWIDVRYQKKTPNSLSEDEIIKLIEGCNEPHHRLVVTLLFALGCRIEEFLNIRKRDCRLIKDEIPYYIVTLREEYSKTKGRDVDLTWRNSTELLQQWLESFSGKDDEQLFNFSYDGIRMFMKRLDERTINKGLAPHLIRHSAATFDAAFMTHGQLCVKYGWSFSSNMPDVYIQRAGVERKAIVEKFKSEKFKDIRKQNEIMNEELKRTIARVTKLEKRRYEELKKIKEKLK